MTTDFIPNATPAVAEARSHNEGLSKTAKAVGAILSVVAWVASGILGLAGLISLLMGLGQGSPEGLLVGLAMAVVAAVTWAQLMLFAIVAKYVAVRTN